MHAGKYLPGLIATLAALPAHAQQATPTPTPAPIPPPIITTIPGVIPERFNLGGTPTRVATPSPTPTPSATATPTSAAPRPAAQAPDRRAVPQPSPTAPAPAEAPAPLPTPANTPAAAVAFPIPVPLPTSTAPPPPAARPWLWALLGAGATALAGLAAWALLRRRRRAVEEAPAAVPEPVYAPPPEPARPPAPPRAPESPAPISADPFDLALQPLRIEIGEREVLIELELLIGNAGAAGADAVRLSIAAISANPRQDAQLAGFRASPQIGPSAEPFDLAPNVAGRMPLRISLPREALHVVELGGRPMFVPIVALDMRWRAGLSIRRFAASFMLGTAGQGGKLGPIWLDRGQPRGPFAASRYVPSAAA